MASKSDLKVGDLVEMRDKGRPLQEIWHCLECQGVNVFFLVMLTPLAQTHRGCRFKCILAEGSKAQKHFVSRLEGILGQGSKAFCLCHPRFKRAKNILGQGSKGSNVPAGVLAEVPVEVLSEVRAEVPAEVSAEAKNQTQ